MKTKIIAEIVQNTSKAPVSVGYQWY